jgi:cation-transporting P-type ATPase F
MNTQKSDWHSQPLSALTKSFNVEVDRGLSDVEVQRRIDLYGPNCLSLRSGKSGLRLLSEQFHQPLVYILLVAASVTAFLQEWVDSSVIFGVVLINAVTGFVQEANALKAIDALSRGLNASATVLREGQHHKILANELVPGDLVVLQSGDKVPADLRLTQIRELQIDESAMTGESVSAEKRLTMLDIDTVLADRCNMAYSSTLVTYGSGLGIVVETGDRTEIGLINRMIASTTDLETPLTRKISQFSRLLLWIIIGMATLTFAVGIGYGHSILEMFMASVALAVGAIPEGLPAALTITLAIGVSRMAKRNAIIRKLPAVETLGSTTVICSDKTGTLTQKQMTVKVIYAGGKLFKVTGSGYNPTGEFRYHCPRIPCSARMLKGGPLM